MKIKSILGCLVAVGAVALMSVGAMAATSVGIEGVYNNSTGAEYKVGDTIPANTNIKVVTDVASNELVDMDTIEGVFNFDTSKYTYRKVIDNLTFVDDLDEETKYGDLNSNEKTKGSVFISYSGKVIDLKKDIIPLSITPRKLFTFVLKTNGDVVYSGNDFYNTINFIQQYKKVDGSKVSIDGLNIHNFVTFTVDKDYIPDTTDKYIVGMNLTIDGTSYTDADGSLKYTEDADGNYVFTVSLSPSETKYLNDVSLVAELAKTEDGESTSVVTLKDFGGVLAQKFK